MYGSIGPSPKSCGVDKADAALGVLIGAGDPAEGEPVGVEVDSRDLLEGKSAHCAIDFHERGEPHRRSACTKRGRDNDIGTGVELD